MKDKRRAKIIAFILFVIISLFITGIMTLVALSLRTEEGRDSIAARVESFGAFAPAAFIFLQMLQVIVALVPGEPVEIIGGVLFGAWFGFLLCLVGSFLASVCIYYAVKKFGKPFIDMFISEEKFKRFRFLHEKKRLEIVTFLLFLLPGTPKDALTYFVPLTKLEPKKFFFLSTLARVPSVISSTMMGASLGEGNITKTVIVFIVTAVIGVAGIIAKNRFDEKNKAE